MTGKVITYDFGDDEHDCTFDYEIDYVDYCKDAITYISKCSNVAEADIRELINDNFMDIDILADDDEFEDYLRDKYYDDACEAKADSDEYNRDPYAYYGVSRSDF